MDTECDQSAGDSRIQTLGKSSTPQTRPCTIQNRRYLLTTPISCTQLYIRNPQQHSSKQWPAYISQLSNTSQQEPLLHMSRSHKNASAASSIPSSSIFSTTPTTTFRPACLLHSEVSGCGHLTHIHHVRPSISMSATKWIEEPGQTPPGGPDQL